MEENNDKGNERLELAQFVMDGLGPLAYFWGKGWLTIETLTSDLPLGAKIPLATYTGIGSILEFLRSYSLIGSPQSGKYEHQFGYLPIELSFPLYIKRRKNEK